MSFGGSGSVSKSKVEIPDFLQPLFEQSANFGEEAFSFLSEMINPNRESVAGFTPQELLAQMMGTNRALDPNGAYGTATDVFEQFASGDNVNQLPAEVLSTLASGGSLAGDMGGLDSLQSVAAGDYLHGGEGFNAALDAAMSRIMPQVRTQFGRSGAGGGTGTLAAESAADRIGEQFAMQYGQERGRMDSAAGLLEQLGLSRDSLSASAGGALGDLNLQQGNQQLGAAGALPGIANLDLEALKSIGLDIRGLEQQKIDKPMNDAMQFLQAIFGVNAFGQPVGQKSRSDATHLGASAPVSTTAGATKASDRRLKRNIERIGTTSGGFPWYSFEYIWGEQSEGVMADEVPADYVVMDPSGYAMVDYSKVL